VPTDVHRFGLIDPGDVSGLRKAIEGGHVKPKEIVAVIGKTHGNGLVDGYTRGHLMMSLSQLIGGHTGESAQSVRERVPFIFSGGVEGVLSPHYAVFTVSPDESNVDSPALAVGVAFTPPLLPKNVGRQRQIDLTAAAVADAMSKAGIASPANVHFVQVKGPACTLADIVEASERGLSCATDNAGKLMAFGRAASALGVARALGEIDPARADESVVLKDFDTAHTMLNDGDMDRQRHIHGAAGAIVASVRNDTALFVSGGAERQGPDTGAMIAVIAEKPGAGAELLVS
jgi:cyanuric acid amidohydrolase